MLQGIHSLFTDKRQEVEAQAEELTHQVGQGSMAALSNKIFEPGEENPFSADQGKLIFENIFKQADKVWGGFGRAPKFPQTFIIKYLLRYHHYTKNEEALRQACLSLDKMIYGGIYDQAGGGFARYSTDAEWLAPHFEKMLYDNALLIEVLCDAYQVTGNKLYKEKVAETIYFIQRELMNEETAFYAALDADSEGKEGKYYVWSFEEINEILGNDAAIFCAFFDVSPQGNWEESNILRVLVPLAAFAAKNNLAESTLEALLKRGLQKLLEVRSSRVPPQLDDKVLLGWNALLNIALSRAAAAFGEPAFKELAIANMKFLLSKFNAVDDTLLYHTYKNGLAKYPAFLDDYAYLIKACIHLQEITSESFYLQEAHRLTALVIEHFTDESGEYFFYTGKSQGDVIVRKQEIYDGAVPSGNSVMCANLLYLSIVFDNPGWREKALKMLYNLADLVVKYPSSFGNWACVLIDEVARINEIAVIGNNYEMLRDTLLNRFIPNKIIQAAESGIGLDFPLLADKSASGEPLVYLCRNYSCQAPESDIQKVISSLAGDINF